MELNKVWLVGRDTYLRLYPNPGFGICWGKRRLAVSLQGGIELFTADPRVIWRRTYSKFSRVKRPGGK